MDDSRRSDAILTLGRKLVDELGLEPSVDTLGRWMAHYLAELIAKCEAGEGNREAKRECFDVILALWRHRSELPNGMRPFEDLEPIIRAVASLDPDDCTPRYFRQARPPKDANKKETEAESWLNLVDGLDCSAKLLIRYCLAQAAKSAVDKSGHWVKIAEAAGIDDGSSEFIVRFFTQDDQLCEESSQYARTRQKIEGRLKRLESFVDMASSLKSDLRAQLEAMPQGPERESNLAGNQ